MPTPSSVLVRRASAAVIAAVLALTLVACDPPSTNIFPIHEPTAYSMVDTWHACRGSNCSRQHQGTDIFAPLGTRIVAVETGVIARVDNTDDGLGGLTVWLRGESNSTYYYAHNQVNLVSVGQSVVRGQTIARVGRTGNAATTPAHVHFQVNTCGELNSSEPCTVNPYPHLRTWAQGS